MKTLTLIRHTTPCIAHGLCYGRLDMDVAGSYHEEVAEIQTRLARIDLFITSPLLRACRLAKHLATESGCELLQDERLLEMNFGAWEGRAWGEISRKEIDAWSADVLNYTPPNGESAQQMMQRVSSLLQEVVQLPQQHIALVAHGGSIRALLALLANIPLSHTLAWQIDYGAVIVVRADSARQKDARRCDAEGM